MDKRVEIVRLLLGDDEVNAVIRDLHGRAWSRARGRARQSHERERRALKEQLTQAERDGSAIVDFLKAKSNLLRAAEMIRAIDRLAEDERDRVGSGRLTTIPRAQWPEVADLLTEVDEAVSATLERIEDVFGPMGPDVIDAEVIDVEDIIELAEVADVQVSADAEVTPSEGS